MSELVYRILTFVGAAGYMAVRSYYQRSLGRGSTDKQFAQMPLRDKVELTVVSLGALPAWVWMLSPWLAFADVALPAWVRFAGLAVLLGASALLVWTHSTLAQNWSPAVEAPRAGELITAGPYQLVRHPMYLSFFLYNLGVGLLSANWLVLGAGLFSAAWLYFSRADREEAVMLQTFGSGYEAYARRTGRVVPGIGKRRLAGRAI